VPLAPNTTLGPYQIVAPLGAGGMGEVYRARDTKLGREVALKILPEAFAADPDRLMRFEREARTLASLNHPHIAQVYGIEDSGSTRALVMELVEGEDLSARIARGPIPLDEALPLARQIAEALEAAHEAGIIHRDLKPANIKVRDDGTVKVLDFGLAKALDAAPDPVSDVATITSPAMTMRGGILGTAAYMAPEQAKGKPVDRRADIWAFGCVLYEMLTGQRAFKGDDITDTMTAVLRDEPDWTQLPPLTTASVRRLLSRCLQKDPRRRLRHIGDVDLEDAVVASAAIDPAAPPWAARTRRSALRVAAPLLLLVGVAATAWSVGRREVMRPLVEAPQVTRLSLVPPPAEELTVTGNAKDVAVSPDGRRVAYVGGNGTALVIRELDRPGGIRVDGVGLPHSPFFSPDGAWVAFVDGISALKRVSTRGGVVETICRITSAGASGAWHGDTIVFAEGGRLFRVPAAGGTPEPVTPAIGEGQPSIFGPVFLPGGQAVLAVLALANGAAGDPTANNGRGPVGIAAIDVRTGSVKLLLPLRGDIGQRAHFVSPGFLIYRAPLQRGDTASPGLRAVAFDPARLEVTGTPVALDEPVFVAPMGGYSVMDLAENGTLVYAPATAQPGQRRLAWVDRDGREEMIAAPSRAYVYPNASPDGRLVAFDIRDQENDTWIWDAQRGSLRRFTFDPDFNQYAVWTRDGQRLVNITGGSIFWQRADGSGQPEVLTQRRGLLAPYAFSDGDRALVFRQDVPETGHDLMLLSLADRMVRPLLQTKFNELNAEISPDGRWLAFESDETGRRDIYVRPFPDAEAGKWQVSSDGGRAPRWSRDGRELFFLALDGAMMAAGSEPGEAFVSKTPTRLFAGRYFVGGASAVGRTYDLSADGRRFLMITPAPSPPISVVLNWNSTLAAKAP